MQAFYRLFNGYVLLMTNERASPCLEEALYAGRERTRVRKGDGPSQFFSSMTSFASAVLDNVLGSLR